MTTIEHAPTAWELPSVRMMDTYAEHPEWLHRVYPLDDTVRAYPNNPWLQIARETAFPQAYIDIHFLVKVWELADEADIRPAVAFYGAGMSTAGHVADIQQFDYREAGYERPLELLMTKTVLYRDREDNMLLVLVSGLGQFQVDEHIDNDIVQLLGAKGRPGHNHTINPDPKVFETDWLIGHKIGLIKPIIHQKLIHHISAIYYLRSQDIAPDDPVAITVSPFEMLIIPRYIWEQAFAWYRETFYSNATKIENSAFSLYRMAA